MIERGRNACFMLDKKGWLAAHVGCSRHCSPEKLDLLLRVNPASLTARTNDGDTLLSLAVSSATRTHPNYALIDDIRRRLDTAGITEGYMIPAQVSSQEEEESHGTAVACLLSLSSLVVIVVDTRIRAVSVSTTAASNRTRGRSTTQSAQGVATTRVITLSTEQTGKNC